MAGSFEFNSFGYALLAAMFGSSAARSLWLILFGVVATSLFVRWAKREQSLQQAPVTDVLLAFFLLTPVLNPWYLVVAGPICGLGADTAGCGTVGRRAAELCDRTQSRRPDAGNLWAAELGAANSNSDSFCSPLSAPFGQRNERAAKPLYCPKASFGGGSALAHDGDLVIDFPKRIPI